MEESSSALRRRNRAMEGTVLRANGAGFPAARQRPTPGSQSKALSTCGKGGESRLLPRRALSPPPSRASQAAPNPTAPTPQALTTRSRGPPTTEESVGPRQPRLGRSRPRPGRRPAALGWQRPCLEPQPRPGHPRPTAKASEATAGPEVSAPAAATGRVSIDVRCCQGLARPRTGSSNPSGADHAAWCIEGCGPRPAPGGDDRRFARCVGVVQLGGAGEGEAALVPTQPPEATGRGDFYSDTAVAGLCLVMVTARPPRLPPAQRWRRPGLGDGGGARARPWRGE